MLALLLIVQSMEIVMLPVMVLHHVKVQLLMDQLIIILICFVMDGIRVLDHQYMPKNQAISI